MGIFYSVNIGGYYTSILTDAAGVSGSFTFTSDNIVSEGQLATVPLNTPSPSALQAPLVTPNQLDSSYDSDSSIDGRYEWDKGLLQVPVGGPPGTPAKIIRVHAGRAKRVVHFTGERMGQWPDSPSENNNNPNEVIAAKDVMPTSPAISMDGTRIYRLTGNYVYYLYSTPLETDRLSAGRANNDGMPSASNDVTPDVWTTTLIDSSTTIPSGYTDG